MAAPSSFTDPAVPSEPTNPSAPSAAGPSRNVNDVRKELIRSALNRKIASRLAYVPPRRPTRNQFIAESLKCLTGETPMPSRWMRHAHEPLFGGHFSDSYFGTWRSNDSLACLRMTLVEYRDQLLSPDEQRVATPYEIKQSMHLGRLSQMRTLWKERLYAGQVDDEMQRRNMKAAASGSFPKESSPSQSVFEEDTEDEDEYYDENEGQDYNVPYHPLSEKSRVVSAPFEYEGIQERLDQSIETIRQLADRAPEALPVMAFPSPTQSYAMRHVSSAPAEWVPRRAVRLNCHKAPPRPPRSLDDSLTDLEQFRDCGCQTQKSEEDKCPTCTSTAVMVAVEGEIF
ncbi:hypothetical protein SBRCBS47491_010249 [Sporothrix bragantina]|uniref:Uncharacterized protein n=1 Tax=Sporothrix bragantina TaxID=671064 RepID=A0ABP0D0U8_9PEZI